jgi:hypothetical protein
MNRKNRIEHISENVFIVDGQFWVERKNGKFYLTESENKEKAFTNEEELFETIDEMTTAGSVGGGYESSGGLQMQIKNPGLKGIKETTDKILGSYDKIRKENEKNFKKDFKDIEKSLDEIFNYEQILNRSDAKDTYRNWYTGGSEDHNGDGITDRADINYGLQDTRYDRIPDTVVKRNSDALKSDPTGEKLMKTAKAKFDRENDTKIPTAQLGSDIEIIPMDMVKDQNKLKAGRDKNGMAKYASLGFDIKESFFVKDDLTNIFEIENKIGSIYKGKKKIFEVVDAAGNYFIFKSDGKGLEILHEQKSTETKKNETLQKMFKILK